MLQSRLSENLADSFGEVDALELANVGESGVCPLHVYFNNTEVKCHVSDFTLPSVWSWNLLRHLYGGRDDTLRNSRMSSHLLRFNPIAPPTICNDPQHLTPLLKFFDDHITQRP